MSVANKVGFACSIVNAASQLNEKFPRASTFSILIGGPSVRFINSSSEGFWGGLKRFFRKDQACDNICDVATSVSCPTIGCIAALTAPDVLASRRSSC